MTSLRTSIRRGMLAGAAGTTALNGIGYLDMVLRGRPASDAPEQTVSALAKRADVDVPGRRAERENRLAGLGPLAGSFTGVTVGALGGVLRGAGVRLPAVLNAPLLGAAAMAATDVPMALLGVSKPRRWTAASWAGDVLPHLGYGVVTHAGLLATEHRLGERQTPKAAVARSLAIGAASGGRSTAGLTAVVVTGSPRRARGVAAKAERPLGKLLTLLLAGGELLLDKHPKAPSRLGPGGLPGRLLAGAGSAAALARRHHVDAGPQAVVGAAAAYGGAWLGHRWRASASQWFGDDLAGALIEDGVVAVLATLAARR